MVAKCEEVQVGGERRWRVTDVVGEEDGLGIECLSGSGAIARYDPASQLTPTEPTCHTGMFILRDHMQSESHAAVLTMSVFLGVLCILGHAVLCCAVLCCALTAPSCSLAPTGFEPSCAIHYWCLCCAVCMLGHFRRASPSHWSVAARWALVLTWLD